MRKLLAVLVCAAAASAVTAGQATPGVSCHTINAKGVGQDNFDGTTSGRVQGGGLLHGTTAGSFAVIGFTPPSTVLIGGTVTFTTNKGTLTVTVTGSFDIAAGAFAASGPVTGSTGKLAGATGSLSFAGVEDLSTGAFTQDITGTICVDLSP
jgi:hypothetical protein